MDLERLTEVLRDWAAAKPLIRKLWIFGSRVRGDNRPDSDLDIAIELDLSAAQGCDDSGGMATWMFDSEGWPEEIQELSGLQVDLQQFDGANTPTIQSGLELSSLPVYVKIST